MQNVIRFMTDALLFQVFMTICMEYLTKVVDGGGGGVVIMIKYKLA